MHRITKITDVLTHSTVWHMPPMARSIAISLALGVPLVLLVLWLMQAMGEYWWLYVWIAWMAFNLAILMIYPTFIAPLFNRFTPLADPALAGRIEALLARCGFRSKGLFFRALRVQPTEALRADG